MHKPMLAGGRVPFSLWLFGWIFGLDIGLDNCLESGYSVEPTESETFCRGVNMVVVGKHFAFLLVVV